MKYRSKNKYENLIGIELMKDNSSEHNDNNRGSPEIPSRSPKRKFAGGSPGIAFRSSKINMLSRGVFRNTVP